MKKQYAQNRFSLQQMSVLVLALVFAFASTIASAVNVNTADVKQLTELDGIGSVKAKAIIDYRKANGSFTSLEELGRVKGIGKRTLELLKDKVSFDATNPVKGGEAAPPSERINLNKATVKELQQLPGIGKAKAEAIVKSRDSRGGFTSLDQLAQVKGISKNTLESIKPHLSLEE